MIEAVQKPALERAEQRLLDALLPKPEKKFSMPDFMKALSGHEEQDEPEQPEQPQASEESSKTRAKLQEMLRKGRLDNRDVEIEVNDRPASLPMFGTPGMDVLGINITEMLG